MAVAKRLAVRTEQSGYANLDYLRNTAIFAVRTVGGCSAMPYNYDFLFGANGYPTTLDGNRQRESSEALILCFLRNNLE